MQYGFVIDQTKCIGCHACTVACKTEHEVPLGVNRTWVKYIEKGTWPDTRRYFSVLRCNHCTDAPCVAICPTTALYKRDDGIVDFDTSRCIGCKSCMQACPYDALYIDPDEHTAQKCNYCVHRVEVGLEPACVVVCPEQAIIPGDLHDPASKISRLVATEKTSVRAPEQGTGPNLFYLGVEESNIDPLLATPFQGGGIWRDPTPVDSFMNVDLTQAADEVDSAAVDHSGDVPRVVYNTDHPMPWGWRVSSYFLTKGIAAGIAIAAAIALLAGVAVDSAFMSWVAPLVAGLFLLATGVLLVWDLKRPDRFYYLLTKGNPGSWLVRGAYILGAHAAVLGLWFIAGVAGADTVVTLAIWLAALIGLATAGYTAFLFGQAEARDLWQSPTLLWHMLAGAFAAGGGAGLLAAMAFDLGDTFARSMAGMLVGGTLALGLIAIAELVSHHPTANIEMAMHHMTRGAYAGQWWVGGQLFGIALPIAAGVAFLAGGLPLWVAALAGLSAWAGIWFADDAMVKAGQSVPIS